MPTWIVDLQPAKRLGLPGDDIVAAIKDAGHQAIETYYDPQNGQIPEDLAAIFTTQVPIILRGSYGFVEWAHSKWPIVPGGFCSDQLSASAWLSAYGSLALNYGGIAATYAELISRREEYEQLLGGSIFVRPSQKSKLICGTVLAPGHLLEDVHFSRHRKWSEPPKDFCLLLNKVRPIEAEWRFVIAGEEVLAHSQYRRNDILSLSPIAPEEAMAVAATIAKHPWRPASVFIVDVAQTEDGFKVMELNTFGTSGLYRCDLGAVVKGVSALADAQRVPAGI